MPGRPPPESGGVLRLCAAADLPAMVAVVNAAATAYAGIIPEDRYHQPYMPLEEMAAEIAAGVRFWGLFDVGGAEGSGRGRQGAAGQPQGTAAGQLQGVAAAQPQGTAAAQPQGTAEGLAGVMGIQDVDDVTLIRHAYVRPDRQRAGVGGRLLAHLLRLAEERGGRRPLLVGTWAAAWWAVAFYQRHGFVLVTSAEKDRLLRRYWNIPERQVETSVVLHHRA